MQTKFQVSAGGVIYRIHEGRPEFALTLKSGKPVWCLPKGLVEKDENPEAAAAREVQEETGLTGKNEGRIGEVEYWYASKEEQTRFHKIVHFFLFRYAGGSPDDHDWEVDQVGWFFQEEALKIMAYPSEREIPAKATGMIGP
ncbi:MAG: NUDIX hydrolase [Actinomycetota bacterium]|nr:NUDIX hydrolase [Actinomycetota bacterium]